MEWPKITFVVCTYNCKENARRCFMSINKQNYPGDVELIACDGGSSDGTWSIYLIAEKPFSDEK